MADIRINALATTATASASDDYLAIDGAANGTRKLSAYSPTFGGNLTVSGTGGNTFNASAITTPSTVAQNGQAFRIISTTTAEVQQGFLNANTFGYFIQVGGSNNYPLLLQPVGSNVLIGTTTDSSNGKLQLATHTTSAGGIGFGTDTSFNRIAAGKLALTDSGSTPTFSLYASSTERARIEASGADVYISSVNASANLYLRSGNLTTALTLDSSQKATFSGNVSVNTAGNSYLDLSTSGVQKANWQLSGNNTFFDCTSGSLNLRTLSASNITLRTNSTTALTIDSSQVCILSGALRLGNVYAAGAPSATGYLTIQDANGNTYKVLVST